MKRAIKNTFEDTIYLSQLLMTVLLVVIYYSQDLSASMMVLIPSLAVLSILQLLVAIHKTYKKIILNFVVGQTEQKYNNQLRNSSTPLFGQRSTKDLNLNSLRSGNQNRNSLQMSSYREELKDNEYRNYSMPKNLQKIQEEEEREFETNTNQKYRQYQYGSEVNDQFEYQPKPRNNKHQMLSKLSSHFANSIQAVEKSSNKYDIKLMGISQTPSRLGQSSVVNLREQKQDYYSTQSGNDELRLLESKYQASEAQINKVFKISVAQLQKHSKNWFMMKMLPTFLTSIENTLSQLNLVLREYFDRKVRESNLFTPQEWVEGSMGTTQVSIDQLLAMYSTVERHGSWLWVPDNIEKFERDHKEKFLNNLKELQLYDKILTVKNGNRFFGSNMRGSILDRLIVINETKLFEYGQDTKQPFPTDMEILSNLFINLINCSIDYEKNRLIKRGNNEALKRELRMEDYKNRMNQFKELFTPMGVWVVNSDQMNIEPPSLQIPQDEPQERTQSPVYFVSQKFSVSHEPIYHVYSDLLYLKLNEREPKYLYNQITQNSLFNSIGLYFVHLLCLPRYFFTKLVSHDYDMNFLSLVLDGAVDLQYRVV